MDFNRSVWEGFGFKDGLCRNGSSFLYCCAKSGLHFRKGTVSGAERVQGFCNAPTMHAAHRAPNVSCQHHHGRYVVSTDPDRSLQFVSMALKTTAVS